MEDIDLTPQTSLMGPAYGSDGGVTGIFVGQVVKVYATTPNVVDVNVPFVGNFRSVDIARLNVGKTRFDVCPLEVGDMVLVAFVGGLISNPIVLMGVAQQGNPGLSGDRNVKASLFTAQSAGGVKAAEWRQVDGNGNVTYEIEGEGGNVTIRLKGQVGNLNIELDKGDLIITVKGGARIAIAGDAEVKASGNVAIDGKSINLGDAKAKVLTEKTLCPYTGLPHQAALGQKTEA